MSFNDAVYKDWCISKSTHKSLFSAQLLSVPGFGLASVILFYVLAVSFVFCTMWTFSKVLFYFIICSILEDIYIILLVLTFKVLKFFSRLWDVSEMLYSNYNLIFNIIYLKSLHFYFCRESIFYFIPFPYSSSFHLNVTIYLFLFFFISSACHSASAFISSLSTDVLSTDFFFLGIS